MAKKSKLIVIGAGVTIGAAASFALRKLFPTEVIPFIPSPFNKISTGGLGIIGGISAVIGFWMKSYGVAAFGVTAIAGCIINIVFPEVAEAKQRALFARAQRMRRNTRKLTPEQAKAMQARKELYLRQGPIGRSSNTEFRSQTAGLDPQATRRAKYKELSIAQPPVRDIAKPYAGYQDNYTIQSTNRGEPKKYSVTETFLTGRHVLA